MPARRITLGLCALLLVAASPGDGQVPVAPVAAVSPSPASLGSPPTMAIVAGTGTGGSPVVPGRALTSPVDHPGRLGADGAGTLYLGFTAASPDRRRLVRISAAGRLSHLVNARGVAGDEVEGPAATSPMFAVSGVAAGLHGEVYVSDAAAHRVVKVDRTGRLSFVAGDGNLGAPTPGPATSSNLTGPSALAVGPDGSLYVVDNNAGHVVRILHGDLSIVAGDGTTGPGLSPAPGVAATDTPIGSVSSVAVRSDGTLYLAGSSSTCLTSIDGSGLVQVVAGICGTPGTATPGPATASALQAISSLTVDGDDNLYLTDASAYVYRIDLAGQLSVVAGTGVDGDLTVGPALSSAVSPGGLAMTWHGKLFMGNPHGRVGVIQLPYTPPPVPAPAPAPSGGGAGAAGAARWFRDPMTQAQRRRLHAVPRVPAGFRGRATLTVAVYRSHGGWVSLPVAWVKGHQLAAHQGATFSGDNLFVGGTARLTTAGRNQLRTMAAALRHAHGITCEGYTDYATPPAVAAASATARAQAVCTQLRAFGVRAGRTVVGYGSRRPVVIGGLASQRSRNRRVVVLMRW